MHKRILSVVHTSVGIVIVRGADQGELIMGVGSRRATKSESEESEGSFSYDSDSVVLIHTKS